MLNLDETKEKIYIQGLHKLLNDFIFTLTNTIWSGGYIFNGKVNVEKLNSTLDKANEIIQDIRLIISELEENNYK